LINLAVKILIAFLALFHFHLTGGYGSHFYYYHREELEDTYEIARNSLKDSIKCTGWYPFWQSTNYYRVGEPWVDWYFYESQRSYSNYYIESYAAYSKRYKKLFSWCEAYFSNEITAFEQELDELNYKLTIEKNNKSEINYCKNKIRELKEKIQTLKSKQPFAQKALQDGFEDVTKELLNLYNNCFQCHQCPRAIYEKGRIFFDRGDTENFVEDISLLLTLNTNQNPEALVLLGEAYNEANLYNQAIQALSDAIKNDPTNKKAYLQRAIAYFENGDQELALSDYLASGLKPTIIEVQKYEKLYKISQGIAAGCIKGGIDSAINFIPSLLSSIYGLGRGAWAFAANPIGVSVELVESAVNCFEFIKENISAEILATLVPELKECIQKWERLEDEQKGHYIGYVIGRYGIDILAWGGCARGMQAYRHLKEANAVFTLEKVAFSGKNAEEISLASKNFSEARGQYTKGCWLHHGQQEKHIPGANNFRQNGSELSLSLKELEQETLPKIGTGLPARGLFGQSGYQEFVEYDKVIGIYVSKDGQTRLPTTIGKIHYNAEGGYHVVPAHPNIFKFKREK